MSIGEQERFQSAVSAKSHARHASPLETSPPFGNNSLGRRLRRLLCVVSTLCLVVASVAADAAIIRYSVTPLGGQDWRYDYVVENDSLTVSIDEFTIFFDSALFQNLSVATSPDGWDSLVAEPIPSISSSGFFDGLALGVGLAPGQSLSGFAVTFAFIGSAIPGSQLFDVVDPITLIPIFSGLTVLAINQVPEPGTLPLLLVGAVGLVAACGGRRRARAQHR